jgi:hypothetical protein
MLMLLIRVPGMSVNRSLNSVAHNLIGHSKTCGNRTWLWLSVIASAKLGETVICSSFVAEKLSLPS